MVHGCYLAFRIPIHVGRWMESGGADGALLRTWIGDREGRLEVILTALTKVAFIIAIRSTIRSKY
ncbi:hypothetical protein P175DRAFT_0502826 [Aspergillus ochraceoroseus IBT 24754]|uniref:Uncharacterized protein n=1 Tax=Aspergillus ochraceoroseus IBT 24754 TaxID=1392256 RepID=A0A2T5LSN6_9EURO|nr:uncharacterized protein P175DRAFT_0502826 [Aspergillus ochraceoroseus IBT 24754]PTU19299.1 hypothetical protein P175DRAFT_0502826 [Aspergillus ochraceoroseus IBT 24754]